MNDTFFASLVSRQVSTLFYSDVFLGVGRVRVDGNDHSNNQIRALVDSQNLVRTSLLSYWKYSIYLWVCRGLRGAENASSRVVQAFLSNEAM
jgi:hypothetical protein